MKLPEAIQTQTFEHQIGTLTFTFRMPVLGDVNTFEDIQKANQSTVDQMVKIAAHYMWGYDETEDQRAQYIKDNIPLSKDSMPKVIEQFTQLLDKLGFSQEKVGSKKKAKA